MAGIRLQDILGQDKAKNLLLRSFGSGKMSHAYLFRGPVGVGKKTTALSFATYINCKNRSNDNDFCGICSSCRKFLSGNHPDYLEVTADGGSIKINQVRELKKKLSFPPFEAGCRIIMLPDVHQGMRRKEVANSLLKTLEEPPADTLFILTADEAGRILDTILSRCQIIPFQPLSYDEISSRLMDHDSLGPKEAYTLAAITGGSLGQAMALAEQGLLDTRLNIVESITGMEKNAGITVEKIFLLANAIAELKDDLFTLFDLLKLWLRDLLLLKSGGDTSFVINKDLCHTYEDVVNRWSHNDLTGKLTCIELAKKQVIQNCNRISVCEMLLWELL